MLYYAIVKNKEIQTFKNVTDVFEKDDMVVIVSDSTEHNIKKKDMIVHGPGEYVLQILELYQSFDEMAQEKAQKYVCEYLYRVAFLFYCAGYYDSSR